jgi:hypothetical protein
VSIVVKRCSKGVHCLHKITAALLYPQVNYRFLLKGNFHFTHFCDCLPVSSKLYGIRILKVYFFLVFAWGRGQGGANAPPIFYLPKNKLFGY